MTESGWRVLSIFEIEQQALQFTHAELEKKIQFIGEFFQFEVRRPADVNEVLPPSVPKLGERRLLDCLWVRTVHFAGKIHYPIEIQLAGNIADTIERLETVANFVQKAIVITDREQQERIISRLRAKKSVLLDKIVFIDIEDIDKIVEAATIMKAFSEKIFS